MRIARNPALASLILLWSFGFSAATMSVAAAQQDETMQNQAPPSPQGYDKPDAGRPIENIDDSTGIADDPLNETANEPSNQSDRNDPPGRAARLQYMTGSVSIQPRGVNDWVQGSVNRPLTVADNVWADKNSRAELNVGTGLIRIGSETSLTLTNVNDNSVQLSLHQGAMNLHVRHLYRGEIFEVDTPNQAFTIFKTGDYRFDVDPNADTTLVTVWRGEGESTGQGRSVRIKEHQQARFSSGNSLAHELRRAPRPDGFDDWCQVRNRRVDSSFSARYVSPDVIGSEDLDDYGTWRTTPEYGHVWVPTHVDSGWSPYSYGHWIYEEPWGWTWVDDAPWGFAPFHYGRWVSFGAYWGWAPGPYYGGWDRGWYAPALVSWYGGGGWGVNIGFGFGGGFGWCPLGWGEPFVPWYHTGWGYFRNVNVYNTRITNINIYRNGFRNGFANGGGFRHANINVRGGFNAVSRGTLEAGLPVRQNSIRIAPNQIRSAPALSRVNASPTLQSRLGPNAGRPAAVAPQRAISRPVISRMSPPVAARSNPSGTFRPGASQQAGVQTTRIGATPHAVGNQPGSITRPSTQSNAGRYVPRPPQSFGASPKEATTNASNSGVRGSNSPRTYQNRSPQAEPQRGAGQGGAVPRPPSGWTPQAHSSGNRGGSIAQSPANNARSELTQGGFRNSVPRPTGRVIPAPRNYSSAGSSTGYSQQRSYGGNQGRYGSAPQASGQYSGQPSGPSRYSGVPSGGRSYGGGGYSAPQSTGRSYGGGSYGGSANGGGRSYGGAQSGGGSQRASGGGSNNSSRGGGRR